MSGVMASGSNPKENFTFTLSCLKIYCIIRIQEEIMETPSEIGKANISGWHPGHPTRIVFIIAKVAMHFEKQKLKASTQVVKSC